MPLRRVYICALVAGLSAVGCKDSSVTFGDFVAAQEAIAELGCACLADTLMQSEAECRAMLTGFLPESAAPCYDELLQQSSTARASFECLLDAADAQVACIESRTCDELIAEYAGIFECADMMDAVPVSFRCDGEADCGDGSDEIGCEDVTVTCQAAFQRDAMACPTLSSADEATLESCLADLN